MIFEIIKNPVITAGIIGALASTIFAVVIDYLKFTKEKKGAYALIRFEIFYSIRLILEFKDTYLKNEIIIDENSKNNKELNNFYNNMVFFPKLTNRNWVNLINFIPSIFKPNEIDKINQFYVKCEEICENSKIISKKTEPQTIKLGKYELDIPYSIEIINNHRNEFRNELDEIIQLGNDVKKIFK